MTRTAFQRACRHHVDWPARVRRADETRWSVGQVVNLSVTGALLHTEHRYRIGERVEVEIDFLSDLNDTREAKTIVSGVGLIVRTDNRIPGRAAVWFTVECGLSTRRAVDQHQTETRVD